MVIRVVSLLLVALGATHLFSQSSVVLPRAHAHNDYLHDRPLMDAVENGFCSVEADIFHVRGKLLVAHTWFDLQMDRTLEDMYLKPLRKLVKENGGSVHGDGTPFTLLIDIKKDGEETYRVLDAMLENYPDVFSSVINGQRKPGPVQAIISGARPVEAITKDETRFVGIDGRLGDLKSDSSPNLLPLISDNWKNNFQWRGEGKFPPAEKEKLKQIIDQAHKKQRRVRFWASPDKKTVWNELNKAGVDLINTDDLPGLRKFLISQP